MPEVKRRYAEGTTVPIGTSMEHCLQVVERYGGEAPSIYTSGTEAGVQFRLDGRQIRIVLPIAPRGDSKYATSPAGRSRDKDQATKAYEQERMRVWRCLHNLLKVKLEMVTDGIESPERAFGMYLVVNEDGATVGDLIEHALASGQQLLPMLKG